MSEPLKLVIPDPQQNVVTLLEERLRQAKAGEVQSVIMLSFYKNKDIGFGVSVAGRLTDMEALGATELFKSGLLKHIWREP